MMPDKEFIFIVRQEGTYARVTINNNCSHIFNVWDKKGKVN